MFFKLYVNTYFPYSGLGSFTYEYRIFSGNNGEVQNQRLNKKAITSTPSA